MKVAFLVAASALLWTSSALAQAVAASKPVSGIWTGTLAPEGDNTGTPATIELRVDGRTVGGVVSGPELIPGDIRDGIFDPQTGTLRFSVVLRGADTRFDFEGAIRRDTLAVRATADGRIMVLRTTRTGDLPAAGPTPAPSPSRDAASSAVHGSFTQVSGWVAAAADIVPADKYGYRPTQSVKTFGEMVGHIADGYNYYCGRAAGQRVGWSEAIEKGRTDKATVVAKLRESLVACEATYAGESQIGPLVQNVAHTSLHYGNLITYMRMLGLTPPSS